jgi:hypothetical protein
MSFPDLGQQGKESAWAQDLRSCKSPQLRPRAKYRQKLVARLRREHLASAASLAPVKWAPIGLVLPLGHGFCLDRAQGRGRAAGVLAPTCHLLPVQTSYSQHTQVRNGTRALIEASLKAKIQSKGNLVGRKSPELELPALEVDSSSTWLRAHYLSSQ